MGLIGGGGGGDVLEGVLGDRNGGMGVCSCRLSSRGHLLAGRRYAPFSWAEEGGGNVVPRPNDCLTTVRWDVGAVAGARLRIGEPGWLRCGTKYIHIVHTVDEKKWGREISIDAGQ